MIRPLIMRELPPDRRRSWTQEVVIEGQDFILTVGEYSDGRPCEIWLESSKEGSFVRGILSILSRTVSIGLQCGESIEAICHSLRGNDFPPSGVVMPVNGCTSLVTCCDSVTDWVASELEDRYLSNVEEPKIQVTEVSVLAEGDPLPQPIMPQKVAGHISQSVWG